MAAAETKAAGQDGVVLLFVAVDCHFVGLVGCLFGYYFWQSWFQVLMCFGLIDLSIYGGGQRFLGLDECTQTKSLTSAHLLDGGCII
mmetsp:Transcript_858/g.2468  ORF Transcript_858/g.2468 Transcript_858/m.2468 type:complete len:87 (+) Transcript_858:1041-1301(+)